MPPTVNIYDALPGHYRTAPRTFLQGLLLAINSAFDGQEILVQNCIDQLFLGTASGRFLIQLGEEQGFTMPQNSGLDIRSYRVLVPSMVADPKQVRETVDGLIQAFYGADRTHPSVIASVSEPYALQSGDDLQVALQIGTTTVSIVTGQVSNLSNVSASEIAAVINSSQDAFFADVTTNRTTGKNFLRLLSKSGGAGSFIRIAGGTLQNVLKFPNLVGTVNQTGTMWTLTRTSLLNDAIRFQWDGTGTNPNVYLSKAGDAITIRGLVDGAAPFSKLNGSYQAVDVGYDYFVIRNTGFASASATLTQPADNSIVFTSDRPLTLFDLSEYALTSEVDANAITATVPAIPPLARRFLAGSEHLHGFQLQVLDFTRTSIKLQLPLNSDIPVKDNRFVLTGRYQRFNARHAYYATTDVDANTAQPTYSVDASTSGFARLPYTTNTPIGTDPIAAQVGSDEYVVTFPFQHGLEYGWGFTLSGATGAGNVMSGQLNVEHGVSRVVNDHVVAFRLKDGSGNPVRFTGIAWGPADVYQWAAPQADRSDFYLQFASAPAAAASGLVAGTTFNIDPSAGTDVYAPIAHTLRYEPLVVTSVNGAIVSFSAGIGPGPNGPIITNAQGQRSGGFGGTPAYRLDKTTVLNQERVFSGLTAVMMARTPSQNPAYVGSFIYDQNGIQTTLTVSKFIVHLTGAVLKGDNPTALLVDSAQVNGEDFPQTGQIVLDYGTSVAEGPVRYLAVVQNPGNTQILIDPAYRFKQSHPVGAQVQYVRANTSYQPVGDGTDYPVYVTGTAQARNTMFALIELIVAAGIFVNNDVVLPNLRYSDPSIAPFN